MFKQSNNLSSSLVKLEMIFEGEEHEYLALEKHDRLHAKYD